jgi:hypothetical protein
MSFLTCCGRSHWTLTAQRIVIPILSVPLLFPYSAAQKPKSNRAVSNILEEKLPSPPPIQWSVGDSEVSLIALAWGPANSPEMISKARELRDQEKPRFLSDRPYVLAIHCRATISGVYVGNGVTVATMSGLARIKNVEGGLEQPWELTPSGFVHFSGSPGTYDLIFNKTNTTEYWDFFPVPPGQKEFLFRVVVPQQPSRNPPFSFGIIVKDNKFVIIKASPTTEPTALEFKTAFDKLPKEARGPAPVIGPGQQRVLNEAYDEIYREQHVQPPDPTVVNPAGPKVAVIALTNLELESCPMVCVPGSDPNDPAYTMYDIQRTKKGVWWCKEGRTISGHVGSSRSALSNGGHLVQHSKGRGWRTLA